MIKIEKVLVATDFGEAADAALQYGREFARTFGAKLHVLNVVENAAMCVGPEAVGLDFARVQADLEAGANEKLAQVVTLEDREQLQAITVIRSGGAKAFEIVAYAKQAGIDVIIVGTHGRGPMAHLMMGSVAEKVVRMAHCPVLTVRHPEREFVVPDALQVLETAAR